MKNIHVLPTDKPSRLLKTILKGNLILSKENIVGSHWENFNLYITTDEEIKEGDYFLYDERTIRYKTNGTEYHGGNLCHISGNHRYPISESKKIILTTNPDLIKDGVQAIDDEFLEWFIKNSSCEFVEVKKQYITPLGDIVDTCYDNERLNYKIIIPQAEPKQDLEKEMFELEQELDIPSHLRWHNSKPKQETTYSYDELRRIAYNAYCLGQFEEPTEGKFNQWINQFKK